MSLFFPKNTKFEKLYWELTSSVSDATALFEKLSHSFKDIPKFSKQFQRIEQQADYITSRIVNELNTAFITPYDRDDMYKLVVVIDSIVDHIENVVHSLDLYDVKRKHKCMNEFSALFTEWARDLQKLIDMFFQKKPDIEAINKLVVAIHKEESEADEIYIRSIKELFKSEKKPTEIIKWKDIIENLEKVSDNFKDVTDIVVNSMMKNW